MNDDEDMYKNVELPMALFITYLAVNADSVLITGVLLECFTSQDHEQKPTVWMGCIIRNTKNEQDLK